MQEVTVQPDTGGQPHAGKVFVAVHAHLPEVALFAGGLCARLMAEGYTGYLVRTTNDEASGGQSAAQNILSNETEHAAMAKALGFRDVFELYYVNHRMNGVSAVELRGRLVLLLRMLKADTVLSFRPSSEGEPDSDRWVTGRAVEEASFAAARANDFDEHAEAGIAPHQVRERYFFYARAGQPFNRVVDVSRYAEKKAAAMVECRSQGGGNAGSRLRARLAQEGRRLPLLGEDDRAADMGLRAAVSAGRVPAVRRAPRLRIRRALRLRGAGGGIRTRKSSSTSRRTRSASEAGPGGVHDTEVSAPSGVGIGPG